MPSSNSSAVLFDLDRVLVDSRAPITGCTNHALETHGLPAQPPIAQRHRTLNPNDFLELDHLLFDEGRDIRDSIDVNRPGALAPLGGLLVLILLTRSRRQVAST